MNVNDMARIHAAAFVYDRPWSADEFSGLLALPHVRPFSQPHGFALVSVIAPDQAELLTLAVDPAHQRGGLGLRLMQNWMTALPVQSAFLEVASDNEPAIALYRRCGFAVCGTRRGYYRRAGGGRVDALAMRTSLTKGQFG